MFAAQLLATFGSALDTDVWTPTNGGWNSQTFRADKVSTAYNQLRLGISPCSTAAPCGGYNFSAGGVVTKNKAWGFGIYTARFKAPKIAGFVANFEVPSPTTHFIKVIIKVTAYPSSDRTQLWAQLTNWKSPRDVITVRISGNQSVAAMDYQCQSKYKYLNWLSPLPFSGNPALAFHNYSIHYMPTYFAFYADNKLMAHFNSTTATSGLPQSTMGITLYVTGTPTAPKVDNAVWIQSVSYQQLGGTTCASASSSSSSSASMIENAALTLLRWLALLS